MGSISLSTPSSSFVGLVDCDGEVHEFRFRTHLFGPGVALNAFELRDGEPAGYQFQIIGDPKDDLLVLLGRLIARIRRALSAKHLMNGSLRLQIANHVVRGRIEWDDAHDGPCRCSSLTVGRSLGKTLAPC